MSTNLLKVKTYDNYPEDLKHILNIITDHPESNRIYGSFKYKPSKYPSDIDTYEIFNICCSREKAIKQSVNMIQHVVKKLDNDKYIFFSEMKIGLDPVYFAPITFYEYNNGKYNINYEQLDISINYFVDSYNDNLFTTEEIEKIKNYYDLILSSNLDESLYAYEDLYNFVRNKYILRWTKNEILNGQKNLIGNRIMTLYEALKDYFTMVKLDIFYPIDSKYIEISNFFSIEATLKNGKKEQLSTSFTGIYNGLEFEIQKYMTSYYFNPIKCCKRMFSLARHKKDLKMLDKLSKILNSEAANLYQLKSELNTLELMFKKIKKIPDYALEIIINQLDNIKLKFATIYQINFDENKIDELLTEIVNKYTKMSYSEITTILNQISGILKPIINDNAMKLMIQNNVYPIPKKYLPSKKFINKYIHDLPKNKKDNVFFQLN